VIARMAFKSMVYLGLTLVIACVLAAGLAMLLDARSYRRAYKRWEKGK
jgi:hypothetical protein